MKGHEHEKFILWESNNSSLGSTIPGTMMPELGRTVNHDEGIALVREWIENMEPGNCD